MVLLTHLSLPHSVLFFTGDTGLYLAAYATQAADANDDQARDDASPTKHAAWGL